MSTITTLAEAKKHLNIETEFTDDDQYIEELIAVAEMSVWDYCNGGISGTTPTYIVNGKITTVFPKDIKHAVLLLTAHLYLNRTLVSFTQGYELPYALKFLLNPYRIYSIQ